MIAEMKTDFTEVGYNEVRPEGEKCVREIFNIQIFNSGGALC